MAKDFGDKEPDFVRLLPILLRSGLQNTNTALYQVIAALIKSTNGVTTSFRKRLLGIEKVIGGTPGSVGLLTATYVTTANETALLVNSRKLLAGAGITIDTSVPGQVTISSEALNAFLLMGAGSSSSNVGAGPGGPTPTDGYWAPLTDGNLIETELIFAAGECVMVFVPL